MDIRPNLLAESVFVDETGRRRIKDLISNSDKIDKDRKEKIAYASSLIRQLIKFCRNRNNLFPGVDFSDPAWDIILDLAAAKLERKSVSVSSVCIAASVPMSTALRWVNQLCELGILVRQKDGYDGRRSIVELSPETFQAVVNYLAVAYVG